MSTWQHQRMPAHIQLLPLPDDGVALSNHPLGWLGTRWGTLLDGPSADARDRVLRGRNYARRGRLRAIDIGPGTATAEVFCETVCHPTLRVRTFGRTEWVTIVEELSRDLDLLASLLEGELPRALHDRLEQKGVRLLPATDELGYDCDCGDYVMPCTHVATVFHVLGDALDGDPFLLLTMRGRSRDQLLASLRAGWGDEAPLAELPDRTEEAPPELDWFESPVGVPDFGCSYGAVVKPGAGVRALGPPPGEGDLLPTLLPIYEGGGQAALRMVDQITDRPVLRRRPRVEVEALPVADADAPTVERDADESAAFDAPTPIARAPARAKAAPKVEKVAPAPAPVPKAAPKATPESLEDELTKRLLGAIGTQGGATSQELAVAVGVTVSKIRESLVDLLELGIVYRTRTPDGIRWSLG